ncbi:hypothetical protein S7711_02476 [Stachybotrys chartarum IBT 7711]|uniref:Uncharacterized protein n=1 Tax=Stachybotrys chartarum (strain CBS 109288 / IBT 7711) TaxID=1280523 RepID=A0A084B557_STACB|nr:hypothetical protein S7711_02476 [Stachybotrys chartarum IBT 7711]KFA48187.1 hypothetical protein S40293_07424 [Stachybotrys chartarum IBT 40293]
MATKIDESQQFHTKASSHMKRRMSNAITEEGQFSTSLTNLYLGISAVFRNEKTAAVALAIHDTVYLVDYCVKQVVLDHAEHDRIAETLIPDIKAYQSEHFVKFIGAGLPTTLQSMSPTLCSRLWLDLDIVPIVMRPDSNSKWKNFWGLKHVDEQADSMARKCIMTFGPSCVPLLQVGFRGAVQTDVGFRVQLATMQNYMSTCGPATWRAMSQFAQNLHSKKIKVAFFSSTPQGGGVALMRHAIIRFAHVMGLDVTWYVPKPKPGVFRITKNIHNILQGVSREDQRISEDDKNSISEWILSNAHRYWLADGGPLQPPEKGGADIIFIDDPQMPGLIPIIKRLTPKRPVLYRSHIQIRSDLIAKEGSPQADIWDYLWGNIEHADMFISHPIPQFVPHTVSREKVAYMPATTDWLDGLNKPLSDLDTGYYGHIYNLQCHSQKATELKWPYRKYIAQVARFDPSKGIPDVIDAYAKFRKQCASKGITDIPQLCICGNGSIDDPDTNGVFDATMNQLETKYPDLVDDCSIMLLNANDQLLNTIIRNAHVILQLSTREGFEVKVSEALHAGRPVIATRAGGIPLQIKDGVNGFLVEPGDSDAVAEKLLRLFGDADLHRKMSEEARTGVSDEVGTVGNALAWFYLASKWYDLGVEPGLKGNERWVNDMAREEAGEPYGEGENRLPREFTQKDSPIHQKS